LMGLFLTEVPPLFTGTIGREVLTHKMQLANPQKPPTETQINHYISQMIKSAIEECCAKDRRDLLNRFEGVEYVAALKNDRDLAQFHDVRMISRFLTGKGEELWWNEERNEIMRGNHPLGDTERFRTVELEDAHNLKSRLKSDDFYLACLAGASRKSRHPLREYLEWCGENAGSDETILEDFATRIFKTRNPLFDTYMRNWFVDAVRLNFEPGTPIRSLLVLANGGRIGKTSLMGCLVPGNRYNPNLVFETKPDKDWQITLSRFWISNFDEIDQSLSRSAAAIDRVHSRLKSLVSQTFQVIRKPYGREYDEIKRSYMLMATTNEVTGLYPEGDQGNDRLWIIDIDPEPFQVDGITCKTFDFEWLTEHRDEIWGAAYRLYKHGYDTSLSVDDLKRQREASEPFSHSNSELDSIRTIVEKKNWLLTVFSIKELMTDLGYPLDQHKKVEQYVSKSLSDLGFKKFRGVRFKTSKRTWWYHDRINPEKLEAVDLTDTVKELVTNHWLK